MQHGPTDDTYYTQVNMTRTIEQILGLPPMNQFDLVASPMRTAFVKGKPPKENFRPWRHVPNQVPLDEGVTASVAPTTENPAAQALRKAWLEKKTQIFAGKLTKPDAEDPDIGNHLNWYLTTGFKRPHPGESKVRPASDFNNPAPTTADTDRLNAKSPSARTLRHRVNATVRGSSRHNEKNTSPVGNRT